jgi:hypothetical protein
LVAETDRQLKSCIVHDNDDLPNMNETPLRSAIPRRNGKLEIQVMGNYEFKMARTIARPRLMKE